MEKLMYLFLYFIIYSFLGFIAETIYVGVKSKKIQNRGFLVGPILPIYGFGSIIITLFLSPYKNNFLILFGMSIIICSVLEYITSYVLEKIFNARWWDYSKNKYNINGRICLETLIPFGLGGAIICYFIHPLIVKLVNIIPINITKIITIIIFIILIIDLILSIKTVLSIKFKLNKSIKDNTLEIKEKVKDAIFNNSILKKRFIESYPSIYEKVKEIIDKNRFNNRKKDN